MRILQLEKSECRIKHYHKEINLFTSIGSIINKQIEFLRNIIFPKNSICFSSLYQFKIILRILQYSSKFANIICFWIILSRADLKHSFSEKKCVILDEF